jgi:hypothetical protein
MSSQVKVFGIAAIEKVVEYLVGYHSEPNENVAPPLEAGLLVNGVVGTSVVGVANMQQL